jgi:hypothetical protein
MCYSNVIINVIEYCNEKHNQWKLNYNLDTKEIVQSENKSQYSKIPQFSYMTCQYKLKVYYYVLLYFF